MNKDALMLVGLIVVLGIAWFTSGGVSDNSVSQQRSLFDARYFDASFQNSIGESSDKLSEEEKIQSTREIEREVVKIQKELALVQKELEKIERFGENSTFKGKVKIVSGAGSARATDVNREYIIIEADRNNTSRISIEGWRIESIITGRGATIEEASYLPRIGEINTELPVNLTPGDRAIITTGRSPIGVSFRINKCTGYFEQFQQFFPALRRICPLPEEEILSTEYPSILIDNACMDLVERTPRCQIRATKLPATLSFECQTSIIEEINYPSCIDKHKNDSDFVGNEWRIYLKRDLELWRGKREIIILFDQNRKVVDTLSY